MKPSDKSVILQARFWAKVRVPHVGEGCWEWQGAQHKFGYGTFWGPERKAHRQSWIFANGPIPKGLWVLHRCDNPCCVRPSHLFLGTCKDNMADCIAKGRFVYGRHVKMTPEQVRKARERYAAGESQRVIGESMGISQAHMSKVVRNTLWIGEEFS